MRFFINCVFVLFFSFIFSICYGQKKGAQNQDHMKAGDEFHNLGDYINAEKEYTTAIMENPQNIDAHYRRALIRMVSNKPEDAIRDLDFIIDNSIGVTDNEYSMRSECKSALRNYEGALSDINFAIKLSPKKGELYRSRASIYTQLHKIQDGIDDYAKCISLADNKTDYWSLSNVFWSNIGIARSNSSIFDEAFDNYDQALFYYKRAANIYITDTSQVGNVLMAYKEIIQVYRLMLANRKYYNLTKYEINASACEYYSLYKAIHLERMQNQNYGVYLGEIKCD